MAEQVVVLREVIAIIDRLDRIGGLGHSAHARLDLARDKLESLLRPAESAVVKFANQAELARAREILKTVEIPPAIDYHGLCNRLAEVFNAEDDTPDELSTEAREAIEALWEERDELRGHIKTLLGMPTETGRQHE